MNSIKFYESDPWLKPFTGKIDTRISRCKRKEKQLTGGKPLSEFAMGHFYYGLHRTETDGFSGRRLPMHRKYF
jgi:1,4-alpha-glucan branching enzyme